MKRDQKRTKKSILKKEKGRENDFLFLFLFLAILGKELPLSLHKMAKFGDFTKFLHQISKMICQSILPLVLKFQSMTKI